MVAHHPAGLDGAAVGHVLEAAGVAADRVVLDQRDIDDRGRFGELTNELRRDVEHPDLGHRRVLVAVNGGDDARGEVLRADARAVEKGRVLLVNDDVGRGNARGEVPNIQIVI